jgi:hypothetical protein
MEDLLYAETIKWADHQTKESYQMSVSVPSLYLTLHQNRPEGIIRE